MAKVRIFLDVDGVLNAVHYNDPPDWGDWKVTMCNGYKIRHSQKMADRLFALRSDDVEIIWLTTWATDANRWISPLFDWPNFYVGGAPSYESTTGWWKFDVVVNHWNQDQTPFVWLDDDLCPPWDDGALEWTNDLGASALPIYPRTDQGLTEAHLDTVEEFVRGWTE